MLAYAASAPRHAERGSNPNAMLAIVAIHVGLLAVVMSAKMDLPQRIIDRPIRIDWIEPIEPPPPNKPLRPSERPHAGPTVSRSLTPVPPLPGPLLLPNPAVLDPGPLVGPSVSPTPTPASMPAPVRFGPQLVTPPSELRPPYPPAMLASGVEAMLRLRLTIDERGRVIAVEPIGRAERAFLDAARRHLIAHWRYKPASEGGRAVAASTVITLRFQLDG